MRLLHRDFWLSLIFWSIEDEFKPLECASARALCGKRYTTGPLAAPEAGVDLFECPDFCTGTGSAICCHDRLDPPFCVWWGLGMVARDGNFSRCSVWLS